MIHNRVKELPDEWRGKAEMLRAMIPNSAVSRARRTAKASTLHACADELERALKEAEQ